MRFARWCSAGTSRSASGSSQRAIEEPLRWIAANAGHEPAIVVEQVKGMKDAVGLQRAIGAV